MKTLFITLTVFISCFSFAQTGKVGINTEFPKATLDIKGTNNQPATSGTTTNATLRVDGSTNHSLDVGTFTNSPYGSYLQSVDKTNLANSLPLILNPNNGNVGINTIVPGSTLTANGSFSAPYKLVTALSYNLTDKDYFVSYNGNALGTFTLPTATAAFPAAGNIMGRVYVIKNTSTTNNLNVVTSGGEFIDNFGNGVSGIGLGQGWTAVIISRGNTGAAITWESYVIIPSSINTIISMSSTSTYNLPSTANFNAGTPQVLPFANTDLQVNQGSSATWDDVNNRYIINESGSYEIDALAFFGAGGTSGSGSWIGVNLGVTKNGTATTNLIAAGRLNIGQTIAGQGNSPVMLHCIVPLLAGDVIYLTMYRGAIDNATGTVKVQSPAGQAESRHFSLKKL